MKEELNLLSIPARMRDILQGLRAINREIRQKIHKDFTFQDYLEINDLNNTIGIELKAMKNTFESKKLNKQ